MALSLPRGMHRASLAQWYHPKEVVPNGSNLDAATGGMRTQLAGGNGIYRAQLQIPSKLSPVFLSFSLYHTGTKHEEFLVSPVERAATAT